MEPSLTLKDGTKISLSDDVYRKIVKMIKTDSLTESADSIEELETEFAILFAEDGPSTRDLMEEHAIERERDERILRTLS